MRLVTKLIDVSEDGIMRDVISSSETEFEESKLASPGTLMRCKIQIENLLNKACNLVVQKDTLNKPKSSNSIFANELRLIATALDQTKNDVTIDIVKISSQFAGSSSLSITIKGL